MRLVLEEDALRKLLATGEACIVQLIDDEVWVMACLTRLTACEGVIAITAYRPLGAVAYASIQSFEERTKRLGIVRRRRYELEAGHSGRYFFSCMSVLPVGSEEEIRAGVCELLITLLRDSVELLTGVFP